MALVKRVSKAMAEATEKERLLIGDLVPSYEWTTNAGEGRCGLKLHYISFLPEREREEDGSNQPAQLSGFCDALTDPVTGSVRDGRNCVPFRVTGTAAVALAARVLAAEAMAYGGDAQAAQAAQAGFDPAKKYVIGTGSLYLDLRPQAEAEALRGENGELVALYAVSGSLSGRMMYALPFEYEEGFE